MPCVSCSP